MQLLCVLLKEGSRVRQKHNCLGIVFIVAMVTTCFGHAWPSSGHKLMLYTNEKKHNCMSGWFAAAVWVGEVRCGWGSSVVDFCGMRMCRILHIRSPQKPSPLEPHPHRTSPTQTAAANQPDIQWCFSHLCSASTLWPEDCQARPKNVVAIAAINRIKWQLCFWRTPLPSFNKRKHNGDDEPEDLFRFSTCFEQPGAHHQESQLYQYIIWYMSLCEGDRPVCRSGRKYPTCTRDGQLHRVTYTRRCIDTIDSWAQGCSKLVENRNKYIYERICASSWLFIRIIICVFVASRSST
jgi:hypothetical protein